MSTPLHNQSGVTLLETLIYIGILGIILTSIITVGFSMITIDRKLKFANEVEENAAFVVQKLGWVLKGAQSINAPPLNESGNTLSVNIASTSGNPYVFDLSNGAIRLKVGTASPLPITNGLVEVSSISFSNYSFSADTKNTIRAKGLIKSFDTSMSASTSLDVLINIQ